MGWQPLWTSQFKYLAQYRLLSDVWNRTNLEKGICVASEVSVRRRRMALGQSMIATLCVESEFQLHCYVRANPKPTISILGESHRCKHACARWPDLCI